MSRNFLITAGFATLIGFLLLAITQLVFASTQVGGQANGYSCDGNQTNRWKTDDESSATLPSGDIIATVDVKAGNNCVPVYPSNSASTCYNVVINGNTVTVTKIGSGSNCKDISHLEGTYSVQATPIPTTVPTATPTPTITPTNTPTPTQTLAITPTPTTDPCADDECVTPTITATPTATATPTNTPCISNCGESNNDNNSGGGSSNNSSQPAQAVLAASTMASTGTFTTTLMNLMLITGMMVLALGGASYAKEKNR